MPNEKSEGNLGQGELLELTPEQCARLEIVNRRCLADTQELVNPNLADTGSTVREHGFVWCRERRLNNK